ncbi:MAG: LCP family protein [Bacilli bacterium]
MKKTRNKKKMNFKNIYLMLFALVTIFFIIFLRIINIIPTLYFIILIVILIILYLIIFFLLKKKKKLGYIISILFIIIYAIITDYLGITMNFFSNFSKIHYSEETFLVIVLKEEYQDINDLQNKNIGYVQNNLNSIDKAIEKIDKKISINKEKYEDFTNLFNDLDNKKIESILIAENYYNIKSEEENTDNYKILYKITIRSIVKSTTKTVDIANEPFTIYISGIDVYGDIETVSRSDVNILMTVNPKTKQVLLTSIPRDFYVQLHGTSGYKDKLTHAGNYGINMSIDTIEDLLNIDINYYIRVNFTTLEKLIDAIDGVDVYSEYSFVSYIDNYKFYQGYNHMNGKQALAFSRERKSLPAGDMDRGKNQEAVIEAIIRKITNKDVIYKYSKILNSMKGTFQTNITDNDITKIIKKELENIGGWNITSNNLDGTGSYDYTYSYSSQKLYVTIPNQDSINNAVNLINKVKNDEKLDSSYSDNPNNIKYPNQIIPEPTPTDQPKEEEKKDNNDNEKENDNTSSDTPLDDILPNNNDNNNDNNSENSNNNNSDNNDSENNNNQENNNLDNLLPNNKEANNP